MAKQVRTKFTDFCENHLYDDFPEPKPLPFKYRSRNKIIYWDSEVAVLENIKQTRFGRNGKGFRFLVSSNYEGNSDLGLLKSILEYTFSRNSRGYASATSILLGRTFGCSYLFGLHIFILNRLGASDSLMVDHIDRFKENNTLSNLRVIKPFVNVRNADKVSDDHPCVYFSEVNSNFYIVIYVGGQIIQKSASSLDEAMLYFDYLVLKNNLNYGLYFDHSYHCFYSDSFLSSRGIILREDILSSFQEPCVRHSANTYQNIFFLSENTWRLQIRHKRKYVLAKHFKTEQEALNFREQFFLENPQYITVFTRCYSPELSLMKALFYPNNSELDIINHSDPKFKKKKHKKED